VPGKKLLRQKEDNYGQGNDQKEILLAAAAGFGLWIVVLSQGLAISAPAVTRTQRNQLEVEQQRLPLAAPACTYSG
jgi:hypothetical protein